MKSMNGVIMKVLGMNLLFLGRLRNIQAIMSRIVSGFAIIGIVAIGSIGLNGCSTLTATIPSAPDPAVVSAISKVCMDSGLFKAVDGTLTIFVPVATLPVALINAGVDKVCASPIQFASDASTVAWLIKNIGGFKL
jgi:hypothetical protein